MYMGGSTSNSPSNLIPVLKRHILDPRVKENVAFPGESGNDRDDNNARPPIVNRANGLNNVVSRMVCHFRVFPWTMKYISRRKLWP